MPRVCVILFVYNEFHSLKKLLPRIIHLINEYEFRIIIVDDGSTDELKEFQRLCIDSKIVFVTHSKNYGIAEAFYSGITEAKKFLNDNDIVIIMEGDGTCDPILLPELYEQIVSNYDIIIASRLCLSKHYIHLSIYRKILSITLNRVLAFVFRTKGNFIKDYTIFYRSYKFGLLKSILLNNEAGFKKLRNFTINTAVLLAAIKQGARIKEIPFIYDYSFKENTSKLKIIPSIFSFIKLIIKTILQESLCKYKKIMREIYGYI